MIVENAARNTLLGESITVARTSAQKVRGLLGKERLEDGQGLLFKSASSLHTFFMTFPIDIIFADRQGRVLKLSPAVKPFKLVAAPLRAYYAIELPEGTIERTMTDIGDQLEMEEDSDLSLAV